jgi:hypothetical protein
MPFLPPQPANDKTSDSTAKGHGNSSLILRLGLGAYDQRRRIGSPNFILLHKVQRAGWAKPTTMNEEAQTPG